jgi:phage terminase small subunit
MIGGVHPVRSAGYSERTMTLKSRYMAFANAVLEGRTPTEAAALAGYSARSADPQGRRLMQRPEIAAYLAEQRAELRERTAISAEKVLREYARIAFAHVRDVVSWTQDAMTMTGSAELDEDVSAAIKSIKITRRATKWGETVEQQVTMHDKLSALAQLAKQLGIATDTLDVRVWREHASEVADQLGVTVDEVMDELRQMGLLAP